MVQVQFWGLDVLDAPLPLPMHMRGVARALHGALLGRPGRKDALHGLYHERRSTAWMAAEGRGWRALALAQSAVPP